METVGWWVGAGRCWQLEGVGSAGRCWAEGRPGRWLGQDSSCQRPGDQTRTCPRRAGGPQVFLGTAAQPWPRWPQTGVQDNGYVGQLAQDTMHLGLGLLEASADHLPGPRGAAGPPIQGQLPVWERGRELRTFPPTHGDLGHMGLEQEACTGRGTHRHTVKQESFMVGVEC